MATDTTEKFSTSTGITITLAPAGVGLAASTTVGRESASIDNGTNGYLDVLVRVALRLATGTPGGNNQIVVYVAGSEDGTNFTDNATGADAPLTIRSPTALRILGIMPIPASATGSLTFQGGPWSVAAAFGGTVPRKWSIVIMNDTGLALTNTEGDHTHTYTGITLHNA